MQDRQSILPNPWHVHKLLQTIRQCNSCFKKCYPSSSEFVGLIADNPDEKIKLKMFNVKIINDAWKLNEEVKWYKNIVVMYNVIQQVIVNYYQVNMQVNQPTDKD